MTTVLKAHSTADLIAMAPYIAGYRSRDSVVILAFAGGRSRGAFRLDLPTRRQTSAYRRLTAVAVSMLSRFVDVDAAVSIVYSDLGFAEEAGTPWFDLARELNRGLHDAGFHLLDSACVAPDGWAGYFDPPGTILPLDELSRPEWEADARERGGPLADAETKYALPETDGALAQAVADGIHLLEAAVDEQHYDAEHHTECEPQHETEHHTGREPQHDTDHAAEQEGRLADLADELESIAPLHPVPWGEVLAERGADDLPARALAFLAVLAASPAQRDALMLQVAFGERIGWIALASSDAANAARNETGESMDEYIARQLDDPDETDSMQRADRLLGQLMMGDHSERPDVERVTRALSTLTLLAANLEPRRRPPVLCMAAWLAWTLGAGSAGGRFVELALGIDPSYGMALVLRTLLGSGRVPEWAFSAAGE